MRTRKLQQLFSELISAKSSFIVRLHDIGVWKYPDSFKALPYVTFAHNLLTLACFITSCMYRVIMGSEP